MSGVGKLAPVRADRPSLGGVTFGEGYEAGFQVDQEVDRLTSSTELRREAYKPFLDFTMSEEGRALLPWTPGGGYDGPRVSPELSQELLDQQMLPRASTLAKLKLELRELGISLPEEAGPGAIQTRLDDMRKRLADRTRKNEAVAEQAPFGAFAGATVSSMSGLETIATLPVGAGARAGILATALVEGSLAAGTEAATTPFRNEFRRELGLTEQSIGMNAATAFVGGAFLGGAVKALQIGGGALMNREKKKAAVAEGKRSESPAARAAAAVVERDIADEELAVASPGDGKAVREHGERQQAALAAQSDPTGPAPTDRPLFEGGARAELGELVLVDPREIEVQPDVFQFKSDADAGGVTAKLRGVTEWRQERAGVTVLFEYNDGRMAVADGHQRTALARRLLEQNPDSSIRLTAKVFREADGFSAEDVRVIAAMKNITEAADGMTAAMAKDAAKVLRVAPDQLDQLPAGPGVARAKELAELSDDAFGLYINEVIPERYAAAVGRLVGDKSLHAPIMRVLERIKPETTEQAETVIRQAMEAPVERGVELDLFGEREFAESLFGERAKVLERALRNLAQDRRVFQTLTDQAETIEGAGNRLDATTNEARRKATEAALVTIKKSAHRAGPVSEALNNAARKYKETGRLGDAARSVGDAILREIERNGGIGERAGGVGRSAEPGGAGGSTPDGALASFSEPDGEGVTRQVANTRDQLTPSSKAREEGVVTTATEETPEGTQTLIEGVAPVTDADRAAAAQERAMRGGDSPPPEGGLFDEAQRNQLDLLDDVPVEQTLEDGEAGVRTMTREELAAELEADDEFAEALGVCLI
jgi:hypothetical protein